MQKIFTLEGDSIIDIPSFFEQINALFMENEEWMLANSLDALDDMLYGAYGALKGEEVATLVWKNIDASKAALGYEATRAFYENKLQYPQHFDVEQITRRLTELDNGTGQSYFEMVLEIIDSHSTIQLVAQ